MANKGEEGRKRKKRRKVDKEKIVLKQSEDKNKTFVYPLCSRTNSRPSIAVAVGSNALKL